jgi:Holliday junction resolvasome RuvABC endonuclease subunit
MYGTQARKLSLKKAGNCYIKQQSLYISKENIVNRKYRVLAIDGALNHSGWVILDEREKKDGSRQTVGSKYGVIMPNAKMSLAFKLSYIKKEVTDLIKTYKPDVVVFEDTYAGKNALTNARLNNAKGVYIVTVFEVTGEDPVYVNAAVARSCLGFGNNKEDPYEFFSKLFDMSESFNKGNDITDAYTLGFWYIIDERGECQERGKKKKNNKKAIEKKKVEKKKRKN